MRTTHRRIGLTLAGIGTASLAGFGAWAGLAGPGDVAARGAAAAEHSQATTQSDRAIAGIERAFAARSSASSPKVQPELGSLVFPTGTTYGEALLALALVNAGVTETIDAKLGGPLPGNAAIGLPGPNSEGFRLSLAAPEGWDPANGYALTNPLALPVAPAGAEGASLRVSTAGPWPHGARIPVPILPECMISRDRTPPAEACDRSAVPSISSEESVPLP